MTDNYREPELANKSSGYRWKGFAMFEELDGAWHKVESDNPWNATTLEWQTPPPPPHGNFPEVPKVYREPYEYSVPGVSEDFIPQSQEG